MNQEMGQELKVIVIGDIHYDQQNDSPVSKREALLGDELLKRIRKTITMEKIDLILVMGDLINDGDGDYSTQYLEVIKAELDVFSTPYIVVPGNHDGDIKAFDSVFSQTEGMYTIGGYQFLVFRDEYNEEGKCVRNQEVMNQLFSRTVKDKPIIALQHNTVYPLLGSIGGYDYDMRMAEQVADRYENEKVLLSISGHYHEGIEPVRRDRVTYMACPALCEQPFRYNLLTLKGGEVTSEVKQLVPEVDVICDYHIHTQFAYCSLDEVRPENVIKRKTMFGIQKIGIIEHAPQLYIPEEDYWQGRFVDEPELIKSFENTAYNRMPAYKAYMESFRSEDVLLGLEVEVDKHGHLAMLDEDLVGWDFLLGAVHYIPKRFKENPTEGFLWTTRWLLNNNVDILAHPFRYFKRAKLRIPTEIFSEVASMLAETNTAVELNYHGNNPDPDFIKLCIEKGVKVAISSDGHELNEVGHYHQHIELLKSIVPPHKLESVLYQRRTGGDQCV